MRRDGRSIREMGRVLGRSPSTISRELRRNRSPVYDFYMDHRAQVRADKRRSKANRRMRLKNDKIRDYVESKLKHDSSPEQIAGRIGIEHRPDEVEARDRFGDWEADTLTSRQSKAAVLSMVERKSRLVQIEKLEAKTAPVTSKAIIKRLLRFPKDARRTLILDNGTENAEHEEISQSTGIS
ncbi:IS30 family transposase, partial [candidate division WOR-3 bacterium]|nr:IS30 family transposase [candidate division WOR-3 bacterium]